MSKRRKLVSFYSALYLTSHYTAHKILLLRVLFKVKEVVLGERDSYESQRPPRALSALKELLREGAPIIAKNESFTTRREAVLTAMEYFEAQETSCTAKESKPGMVHYLCSASGCPGAVILRFIEK